MNTHEVAADLDDKSIKILRLLLREERHLNPGLHATLTTPMVTREYGWTNQTVLRRFRKLRDVGLVNFGDVRSELPDHDRYPRPPKAIDRCIGADELREILAEWNGRETRSPAQLTTDLENLDYRIDSIDDLHTNRTDALQSALDDHLDHHNAADRHRAHLSTRALYISVGALASSIVVLLALALLAPDLLITVLLTTLLAVHVGAVLAGASIYVLTHRLRSRTDRDAPQTTTEHDHSRTDTERDESQLITE